MDENHIQRKLTAIFSADVVGYSRLMRDDEMATVDTVSEYRQLMADLILQHKGRVIDASGDNVLAEFSSVVDAVQSAVAIQRELKTRNTRLPDDRRMEFRIGINIGDVIQEDDRIYGDGVNIAARLESIAEPGGICISRSAYDQIESKLPFGYAYLGEQTAKNINKPLYAYRVVLDPENEARRKGRAEGRSPEGRQSRDGDGAKAGAPDGSDGPPGRERHLGDKRPGKGPTLGKGKTRDTPPGRADSRHRYVRDRLREGVEEIADGSFPGGDVSESLQEQEDTGTFLRSKHLQLPLILGLFIFAINALTSFGSWWFHFPLLCIGLVGYLRWINGPFRSSKKMSALREKIFDEEMEAFPDKSDVSVRDIKRIEHRIGESSRFHRSVYRFIGGNAFLILLNLSTGNSNLWFKYPLVIWGFFLFLRWTRANKLLPK